MTNSKRAIAPLLLGIIGLSTLMRNPRFDTFHVVDVLQLIGSGMCLGVSLGLLLGRQKSSDE